MQPILDDESLTRWLAWAQLVVGIVFLIIGLRSRDRIAKLMPPPAAMAIAAGLVMLLRGAVSDNVLIPIVVIVFVLLVIWSWREFRAFHAHLRELRKQR